MFYRSDGTTTTVTTQAAQDALSGAWFDSPADYGLITAPSVDDVAETTNTAAATPNAPMIWNPSNSGKNLVVHKIEFGYVGTTWAPGHIEYGVVLNAGSQTGTGAPIVSLTQVAGVNLLLGAGNTSVMRFAPTTLVVI